MNRRNASGLASGLSISPGKGFAPRAKSKNEGIGGLGRRVDERLGVEKSPCPRKALSALQEMFAPTIFPTAVDEFEIDGAQFLHASCTVVEAYSHVICDLIPCCCCCAFP